MTPSTEKPNALDRLEEELNPHADKPPSEEHHNDVDPGPNATPTPKRIRVTHKD